MNKPFELNGSLQDAVANYSKSIARAAFTYLKNTADAEDITQEVFLALLEKQPHFESEEHLKAWLLRVAINKSKNALKSGWFTRTQPLFEALPALSPQENEVLSCVLSLDEKYRIPIHLFYYEGYSIEEIGKILRLNPATVGTRLARGRALLKKNDWKHRLKEQLLHCSQKNFVLFSHRQKFQFHRNRKNYLSI